MDDEVVDEAKTTATDEAEKAGGDVSIYKSGPALTALLEKLSKNVWELSLCKLAGAATPGRLLDLSADGSQNVKEAMEAITAAYTLDFPPPLPPSTAIITHQNSGPCALSVISEAMVEDDTDFKRKLSAFNAESERQETNEVKSFLDLRVSFIVDELGNKSLADKMKKLQAESNKRKLFVYDCAVDGDACYSAAKKKKTNLHSGTGPGLAKDRFQVHLFD